MTTSLPPEDQPAGEGLIPVTDEVAVAAVAAENPDDSPVALGAALHYALTREEGPACDFLSTVVTLESVPSWGDFTRAREMLAGTAMMSRADEPAPGVAYVRYVADEGVSLQVDGDFALPVRAIATLVFSPENERWQVHALGDPILAEHLPASLF